MNPIARYFTLERAIPALGAFPLSAFVLYQGAVAARTAAAEGDPLSAAAGVAAVAAAVLLAVGAVEYFRMLRSMHRANRAVQVLHNVSLAVLSCGVVYLASGREWIALALIPGIAVAGELRDSRAQLRDRSTCKEDPSFPEDVEKGMRAWSGDGERRPVAAPAAEDDQSWKCPHFLTWRELRPRAIAEYFAQRLLRFAYLGGTAMVVLAVLVNAPAFAMGQSNTIGVLVLLVGVPLLLNRIAYAEGNASAYMHRQPTTVYALSLLAYAATAAVAGLAAQVLDRPYLWALVPLAACMIAQMLYRAVRFSDPATCRSQPGPLPVMQARMKP